MNYEKEKSRIDSYNNLKLLQDEYIILLQTCLLELNNEINPPAYKKVYQNLLQRFYYSIKTSTILMQLFNRDKNYKMPVALQLRTGLLDSITAVYLYQFIDTCDNEETKFINALDVLNVPMCREFLKEIKSKNLKKKDLEFQLKNAKSIFPNNFTEENGEIVLDKNIEEIKPNDMIKSIKFGPFKSYERAYGLYRFFSKYEHYGIISKVILDDDADLEFNRFLESTFYIFDASKVSLELMGFQQERIDKIIDLTKKVLNIKPLLVN